MDYNDTTIAFEVASADLTLRISQIQQEVWLEIFHDICSAVAATVNMCITGRKQHTHNEGVVALYGRPPCMLQGCIVIR